MGDLPAETAFAYDAVAYPTPILALQTPDRLCAAGLMHGWRAPDPVNASVLEIGCGNGLNLIGIGAVAPTARCVGFDLSGAAIERGRDLVRRVGLQNVDLHRGDILTYPRDGDRFDYVVCHGVYSWIPQPVRGALMELIAARLAPGGVAYVSFDALPAASPKAFINAFLMRELAGIENVDERILGATRLLMLLARNQRPESRLTGQLQQLLADLDRFDPGYFFHDWLAEHYAPVRLEEFGAQAEAVGLRRAGDTALYDLFTGDLDDEARAMVEACGDDIPRRSALLYMLRGSHVFRREFLVRTDAPPLPQDKSSALRSLRFGYLGSREPIEDETGKGIRYTDGPDGFIVARVPMLISVMDQLHAASPAEMSFDDLLAATGADAEELEDILRAAATMTVVDVHASPQNFVTRPGPYPRTSDLVRTMLIDGNQAITLRHSKFVASHDATRVFLILCDGTRNREDLAEAMQRNFGSEFVPEKIEAALAEFARYRVFEA